MMVMATMMPVMRRLRERRRRSEEQDEDKSNLFHISIVDALLTRADVIA
jgi:hypothetical protein